MDDIRMVQPIAYLLIWIVLAIVGKPIKDGLEGVDQVVGELFRHVIDSAGDGKTKVNSGGSTAEGASQELWQVVQSIFLETVDSLGVVISRVLSYWTGLRDRFGPPEIRPWRMIGALAYLASSVAFVYADMAQGANSVSGLFPDIQVPAVLQNLLVPILVASAGSAGMLGMIVLDFLGVSNFAGWDRLKGKTRTSIFVLTVVTLLSTLIFSFLLALSRFSATVAVSPATQEMLRAWASFAQAAIFVPMLITTALVAWWGLGGLLVTWLAIVGAVVLALQVARFLLQLVIRLLGLGDKGSDVVLKLLFALLELMFSILGLLSRLTQTSVHLLFVALLFLLGVITYPLAGFHGWITRFYWARDTLKLGPHAGNGDRPGDAASG